MNKSSFHCTAVQHHPSVLDMDKNKKKTHPLIEGWEFRVHACTEITWSLHWKTTVFAVFLNMCKQLIYGTCARCWCTLPRGTARNWISIPFYGIMKCRWAFVPQTTPLVSTFQHAITGLACSHAVTLAERQHLTQIIHLTEWLTVIHLMALRRRRKRFLPYASLFKYSFSQQRTGLLRSDSLVTEWASTPIKRESFNSLRLCTSPSRFAVFREHPVSAKCYSLIKYHRL